MTEDSEPTAEGSESTADDPEGVFERIDVGDTDTTQGRTVTDADVTNFAGVSGDFNHLHTDEERMADSMFGERIAHGMFVLSAATGLLWQSRTPEERNAVVAFYGIDDLRFRQPVYIGDTIHVETEVLATEPKSDSPGNGTVTTAVEVVNQREQAVLSCEMTSLLR